MYEVGKTYFFRIKSPNKEIIYTGKIIELNQTQIKIIDKFGTPRILTASEIIEGEVKQ